MELSVSFAIFVRTHIQLVMETRFHLRLILLAFVVGLGVMSCTDDENTSDLRFIENARLLEEGQTLSPGDAVHLMGEGYLDTDNVMLSFYWETGEPDFPEGYITGYRAEIVGTAPDGITIRLPYRKPEARVEVLVMRSGVSMLVGELYVEAGTTPDDVRLYGITRSDGTAKCVWNANPETQWTLDGCPDFHSAVSCWGCYGVCGLSETGGMQYPVFFDFCMSEWKRLGGYPTLALFTFPAGVGSLHIVDGENYTLDVISDHLERNDYISTASRNVPAPLYKFPLPEGLEAEMFGDYPGAYTGTETLLFSANKGNGAWTPVAYAIYDGFHTLDDVEADGLIPFSFRDKKGEWRCGYIAARDGASELYLLGKDVETPFDKPCTMFEGRALSASANYDRPGTLTVLFETDASEHALWEFSLEENTWKHIGDDGCAFDEIVWTN